MSHLQQAKELVAEWFGKSLCSDDFTSKCIAALRAFIAEADGRLRTVDEATAMKGGSWVNAEDVQRLAGKLDAAMNQSVATHPMLADVISQAVNYFENLPAAVSDEPVAWRDHVEERIRSWRQTTMNRSGDLLAIDDFMGADDIDDLVDYVCDEYAGPAPSPKPAAQRQEPLPMLCSDIEAAFKKAGGRWTGDHWIIEDADLHPFVRGLLAEPKDGA